MRPQRSSWRPGGGDRLYQQNHCGMYRSADGGRAWQSIEAGLPSRLWLLGRRRIRATP